jgi:predicted dehydrogenase
MKKLKTAVIGQGRSGRNIHGKFFATPENEYIDVKVVVELDPARRELARKEYPDAEVIEDYRKLFGRDDIELVVNSTYSMDHYEITKSLLSGGLNVVVEKPFARSYYECSDLIKIAKDNGVFLAVFQQSFYAPFYVAAKEIADSGKLGEIKQVSIRYNGFSRRWDWQTTQKMMGGGIYNTGPHPIGIALAFLDFDDEFKVEYSKLGIGLTFGDSDDYAKIILSAPGKPVVDVEVSSIDAFSDYNIKIQGTRGTYKTKIGDYKIKYVVDGENPDREVVLKSLKDKDGMPVYCSEKLVAHEEEGSFDGSAFDVGTREFYKRVYDAIRNGVPMEITNDDVAKIIRVIETVHAENPLPKRI